jgi:hypothetical protein
VLQRYLVNLIVAKTDTAKTLPKPCKCGFL